jgi:C4-dicarboxylate-specific signal transduction histidine kinase
VKKQQPNVRSVDANEIVKDTLLLMAFDLRQANVKPGLDLADGLPPVLADPVQIGQVLINLFRNALDAMQSVAGTARALSVSSWRNGQGYVSISVTDSGCGTSDEILPRIFDAFYTTKPEGLGIGLALCRTIIEEHGGQLTAQNNLSRGMTFAITLRPAV